MIANSKANNHPFSFDDAHTLFDELYSYLKYAPTYHNEIKRELNRKLANEFNVLDFLRVDEIGLSKIIAHLLNPSASHGQGVRFLYQFLQMVKSEIHWDHLEPENVRVETEHYTSPTCRLDIMVEISGEFPFLLAIENKPYAGDGDSQVLNYLNDLKKMDKSFLLVYLSPKNEGPSENSFPKEERKRWEQHFKVMAYAETASVVEEGEDAEMDHEVQNIVLLTTWLKQCKEKCEVDKLRWFLTDTENFCVKTFTQMEAVNPIEVQIVESFLRDNPKYIDTAHKVSEAWPKFVNFVSKRFLEQLVTRIEQRYEGRDDLEIERSFDFTEDQKGYVYIRLRNRNWIRCDDGRPATSGGYCIELRNGIKGKYHWWYVGVRGAVEFSKLDDDSKIRDEKIKEGKNHIAKKLERDIKEIKSDQFMNPIYFYVDTAHRDWEPILSHLFEETENNEGANLDYFFNLFTNFAEAAMYVMDKCCGKP